MISFCLKDNNETKKSQIEVLRISKERHSSKKEMFLSNQKLIRIIRVKFLSIKIFLNNIHLLIAFTLIVTLLLPGKYLSISDLTEPPYHKYILKVHTRRIVSQKIYCLMY